MSIVEQTTHTDLLHQKLPVSRIELNLNHWFPVAASDRIAPGKIYPVTLWERDIALFKTSSGKWKALQNTCLHKGIPLHLGKVADDHVICGNHGWQFDENGKCSDIPYLEKNDACPQDCLQSYEVTEKYGLIWVFPGQQHLACQTDIPTIGEYQGLSNNLIQFSFTIDAHFSICLENDMDVFHDHLSKSLVGWSAPFLENMERIEKSLSAHYVVKTKPKRTAFERLSLEYNYPHIKCSTGDKNQLYIFHQPIHKTKTKTYLFYFKEGYARAQTKSPLQNFFENYRLKSRLKKSTQMQKSLLEKEHQSQKETDFKERTEINPVIKALRREIEDQHLLICS